MYSIFCSFWLQENNTEIIQVPPEFINFVEEQEILEYIMEDYPDVHIDCIYKDIVLHGPTDHVRQVKQILEYRVSSKTITDFNIVGTSLATRESRKARIQARIEECIFWGVADGHP